MKRSVLTKVQNHIVKRYVIVLFLVMLFGCKQENIVDCENCVIWGARPIATISDGKVQLNWENPMSYILPSVPT